MTVPSTCWRYFRQSVFLKFSLSHGFSRRELRTARLKEVFFGLSSSVWLSVLQYSNRSYIHAFTNCSIFCSSHLSIVPGPFTRFNQSRVCSISHSAVLASPCRVLIKFLSSGRVSKPIFFNLRKNLVCRYSIFVICQSAKNASLATIFKAFSLSVFLKKLQGELPSACRKSIGTPGKKAFTRSVVEGLLSAVSMTILRELPSRKFTWTALGSLCEPFRIES